MDKHPKPLPYLQQLAQEQVVDLRPGGVMSQEGKGYSCRQQLL